MKNILIHLRLPFSFFLLPVFLFALAQSPNPDSSKAWWIFFILHFLLFPASNAYNSYFDKDEGSIGLLETPPPVTKELFYVSWILDIIGLVLGYIFVSQSFAVYLIIYGFISKAYSHPNIRLKKYPVLSWIIVCLFQGALTYLAVYFSINQGSLPSSAIIPSLICTSNLLAIYPITQVYQHEEDAKRGDLTMSRLLGIKGTFVNALFWLGVSSIGYFIALKPISNFFIFGLMTFPLMSFLVIWIFKVWKDTAAANFKMTMMLNLLASICLNAFFGMLYFLNH